MTYTNSLQSKRAWLRALRGGSGAIRVYKKQTLEGGINSGSHFWRPRNHLETWVYPGTSGVTAKPPNKDKTFTRTCAWSQTHAHAHPSSDGRKP